MLGKVLADYWWPAAGAEEVPLRRLEHAAAGRIPGTDWSVL